ncbi:unnamed protein product, partial [Pylaiella littoralis]
MLRGHPIYLSSPSAASCLSSLSDPYDESFISCTTVLLQELLHAVWSAAATAGQCGIVKWTNGRGTSSTPTSTALDVTTLPECHVGPAFGSEYAGCWMLQWPE